MAARVEAQNVSKTYQLGDTEVHALRDVNLEIRSGEFVALLGPSGSGKSSLLHILGAMDRPSSGSVLLDGRDISAISDAERTELRLRRIGFVFQTFNLIPTLTALENVALPMRLAGMSKRKRTARASLLLGKVGLADRAGHLPRQLSGGQRQRVAIARALANDPGLILADEPTGNLDTEAGRAVLEVLGALHDEGVALVLVTHNPAMAERADKVLAVCDGKLATTLGTDASGHYRPEDPTG